jgi:signal transduction histidine kinase
MKSEESIEESTEELLDYFRLDQHDLDALANLRGAFETHADRLVDEFYRHLLRFPTTQRLLRNEEVRARLLEKQREYLISLTDPVIDEAYLARRAEVGTTHERIGLETKWYLGAYALYFNLLVPVIYEETGPEPLTLGAAVTALAKRLLFDAEIAIRQYTDRREEDLRGLNRALTIASQKLRQEVSDTSHDLVRTRKRAYAAEQLASVATLVTGLAHEIGTPMGVLRGHAEALESAVQGERAQWRLEMILQQIDRITTIMQSLLNIARPRESQRVPVDLDDIARTVATFLAEKMKRRNVEIVFDTRPYPEILGDPEKLQQVFLNLFINAIDAMPEGGTVQVDVGAASEAAAEIRVSDTGTGIDPDDIESIFDPFYTTKAAGHGNGLGLVVVKGIIDEHGGSVEVLSRPGAGTEFAILIPSGEVRQPAA